MMRGARGAREGAQIMRRRLATPTVALLAAGAVFVAVLCIVAINDTDAIWLILLTVVAIALIAVAIVVDLRRVIDDEPPPDAPSIAPGRAILVSTEPMSTTEVLQALDPLEGEARSIMVVCPEGQGGYDHAHRVESATVAALRAAGINAAGQVGDRNPGHAIVNALALFPARKVVVVTQAAQFDVYREHVDPEELRRTTGAELRFIPTG
jgi:hypothetical protein